MWVIVFFDIPTTKPYYLRPYQKFRNFILNDGFVMLQKSIYVRYSDTIEISETHIRRIKSNLPIVGEIRILKITDKQYQKIDIFSENTKILPESPPEQISMF